MARKNKRTTTTPPRDPGGRPPLPATLRRERWTLRLPPALIAALRRAARARGMPASALVEDAIRRELALPPADR